MSPAKPPEPAATETALFLDFDGTLVPLAAHPDAVTLPPRQRRLLSECHALWEGAVALVSGRHLQDLEHLTTPLPMTLVGCHGAQWRTFDGNRHALKREHHDASRIATVLGEFCDRHPGTFFEDKTYAFALHYRQAPQCQDACRDIMHRLQQAHGRHYTLSEGKCLLELRQAGCHKGRAIEALLETPPFRDRTPIFIGDDSTDEDAFPIVNAHNGISIRVGKTVGSKARYHLNSVEEVLTWLESLLSTQSR